MSSALEDILNRMWGAEFIGEPQVVYVNIRWLREKLESNPNKPRRIINVRGVGTNSFPWQLITRRPRLTRTHCIFAESVHPICPSCSSAPGRTGHSLSCRGSGSSLSRVV